VSAGAHIGDGRDKHPDRPDECGQTLLLKLPLNFDRNQRHEVQLD